MPGLLQPGPGTTLGGGVPIVAFPFRNETFLSTRPRADGMMAAGWHERTFVVGGDSGADHCPLADRPAVPLGSQRRNDKEDISATREEERERGQVIQAREHCCEAG